MSIAVTFILFIFLMIISLIAKINMVVPLILGVAMFSTLAIIKGNSCKMLLKAIKDGAFESLVVVKILLLIGCVTSLWRATGTIAYFVYYGIKIIPPNMFVVSAFLLCAVMSYALGTSFGVSGTVGVIIMTMARASGINPVIAAGAVLSGVYFGDRSAPASSCASLVANITKTKLNNNVKLLLKSSIIPMVICVIAYTLLSFTNKLDSGGSSILPLFCQQYSLSLWCILPVIALIVPVFMGMRIDLVLAINILISYIIAICLQGMDFATVFKGMIVGYEPTIVQLSDMLSGGGMLSLLKVGAIVLISCTLAGIFKATGMLAVLENKLYDISQKVGRFPAMVLTSFLACAAFCNQTIGIIMCRQFMRKSYGDTDTERTELMMDLSNSTVVIAGIVPWSIASSIPLAMIGGDMRSIPFAIYLYAVPLCWYIHIKKVEKNNKNEREASK